jgi:hypothetical protein
MDIVPVEILKDLFFIERGFLSRQTLMEVT